ncbi:MAG: hypothetical protein RLZZ306_811, partial [Bacteroidota bacterium]
MVDLLDLINYYTKRYSSMKSKIPIFLFCFICSNTVFAQVNSFPSSDYFIAKMKSKFELALKKDTAALRPMLHDSLLYIHSGGNADSKQAFLNKIASTKNPYKKFTINREIVRQINKEVVLVHARSLVEYENGESSYLLITETYVK